MPPLSEGAKMSLKRISRLLMASLLLISAAALSVRAQNGYSRDPSQLVDDEYTKKIREYTTETFFNSPLTDYLPASPNVPTPKVVLGDVAGSPGKLPYAEDVYRYMRLLEKASPRVKVFSIGTTEEGRVSMRPKPIDWWPSLFPSITSPAQFTRLRPARRPR